MVKLQREVITDRDLKREVVLRKERAAMNYDRNVQFIRLGLIIINIGAIIAVLKYA